MKRLLFFLSLIPLIFGISDLTSAGGGIVTTDEEPVSIGAIDIRYIVDSESGTITAEIQQLIVGESNHYVWLYPVPDDNPIVELGGDAYRRPMLTVQVPNFQTPPNFCTHIYDYYPPAGGSGAGVIPDISVDTSEQVINGNIMVQWLSDNNYEYEPEHLAIIADYAEQGMSFVVVEYTLTLNEGYRANLSFFAPIRITYHADDVLLPLRLTGLSIKETSWDSYYPNDFDIYTRIDNVPMRITIEGDGRYISATYPNVFVDYSRLRGVHAVAHLYVDSDTSYSIYDDDYARNRSEILNGQDGRAFLTEYAGRVDDANPDDPYITQLYAEIPPSRMTEDVRFVLDPNGQDTPTEIDLSELVDPLDFWGCSTRTLRDGGRLYIGVDFQSIEKDLPDGRTGATVHPEGWMRTEFAFPPLWDSIVAFSSEKITAQMILDYFAGEATPPMLLYVPATQTSGAFSHPFDVISTRFNRHIPYYRAWWHPSYTIYWIVVLTSDEDFYRNEAMYRAMVDYEFTSRYLRHPDLLHTLYYRDMTIAYPEGWIERMEDDERMIIAPENVEDTASVPYVRVYPLEDIVDEPIDLSELDYEVVFDWIGDYFNLDQAVVAEMSEDRCSNGPMRFFSAEGRTGYMSYRRAGDLIIEISAPDEIYAEYAETIENMQGVFDPVIGCG